MTNKEALLANINFPVKDQSLDIALINAKIAPEEDYSLENREKVETALAGLILIVATGPKSVSELDYSISSQDMDGLMELRSIILKRYNLPDELAYKGAIIQDATQFWGTTNYD